ncbi:21504_t:CDS:1, partial [Dentiscutata erythropus]
MGISYKRRSQLKNCNKIRLEKQHNKTMINNINQCLDTMDSNQLQYILNTIQSTLTMSEDNSQPVIE